MRRTIAQFRHPDRSEAEWRDLFCRRSIQFRSAPKKVPRLRLATLGFARDDGVCYSHSMRRMKRRKFLGTSALAAALPTRIFAQTATSRPQLLQSVQSGDVSSDGTVVWSRADRPARMIVE